MDIFLLGRPFNISARLLAQKAVRLLYSKTADIKIPISNGGFEKTVNTQANYTVRQWLWAKMKERNQPKASFLSNLASFLCGRAPLPPAVDVESRQRFTWAECYRDESWQLELACIYFINRG
ncbi:hypothetical protein DPEC_G00251410 [Dallia pectoralis]|uniref:Uncharacterized protein n=1 Tax=Dallia pectoralis TaxID=75939 RepID=A0ACC2FTA3_DALPE|nr:hypothetical protein DPEC_G00251410 [Dallia pectoralis]